MYRLLLGVAKRQAGYKTKGKLYYQSQTSMQAKKAGNKKAGSNKTGKSESNLKKKVRIQK